MWCYWCPLLSQLIKNINKLWIHPKIQKWDLPGQSKSLSVEKHFSFPCDPFLGFPVLLTFYPIPWVFFLGASTSIKRCLCRFALLLACFPSGLGCSSQISLKSNQGIVLGMSLSRNWCDASDLMLFLFFSVLQAYLSRLCIFKCSMPLSCVFTTNPIYIPCHKPYSAVLPMLVGFRVKGLLQSFVRTVCTVYVLETDRHKVQEMFVWLCHIWVWFPSCKAWMKPFHACFSCNS